MILFWFSLSLLSCMWSLSGAKELDCSKLNLTNSQPMGKTVQAKGDRFSEFDWDLSKELSEEKEGNLVVSPISIKVVLAMLYEGSRGNTAREIGEALDLNTNSSRPYTRERFSSILNSLQTFKGQYEIRMGTHVFIDKSAKPNETYQCKLKLFYNSDMKSVDFKDSAKAAETINTWASNVTEGHIQNFISEAEAHSNTVMLLLNAVFFKGLWEKPFPEKKTRPNKFFLNKKQSVDVPMMNTRDDFLYIDLTDFNAQLIKLRYMGGKFAMYVLLPRRKNGLNALLNSLGPDRPLAAYIANMTETPINLIMPKFEFDFTTSLRKALEKLNIKTMFSAGAELSDIAEASAAGLVVSNVLQKAGISVTEIGTVAYAATAVGIQNKFGDNDEFVEFKVDRPFLFFIEDQMEKTTVFVGKVTNPEKAQVASEQSQPLAADTVTAAPPSGSTVYPPSPPVASHTSETEVPLPDNNVVDRINEPTQEQQTNKARFNTFDANLLKEIGTKQESGNFIISPTSVKIMLAMIMEGAENKTLTDIRDLLQLPKDTKKAHALLGSIFNTLKKKPLNGVTVDLNSQVYMNKQLTPNTMYAQTIGQLYGAALTRQDFSDPITAAASINDDINERTKYHISNVISSDMISSSFYALLLNTLYFEGTWKFSFSKEDSARSCFYPETNVCECATMMSNNANLNYAFDLELNSHILQIPYEDERFSMVIVMPIARDGIRQLTHSASQITFPKILKDLKEYDVTFRMPKFTVEHKEELTPILSKLGVQRLFTPRAELPNMIQQKNGQVNAIVQKAKIEVSEKGTKAAAATAAGIVPLIIDNNSVRLNIDHPFYYFIYERESASVLFAGRLSTVPGAGHQPCLSSSVTNGGTASGDLMGQSSSSFSSRRPTLQHESAIEYPKRNTLPRHPHHNR